MANDLIDWGSLKTPTEPSDETCPNCKSTRTRLQQSSYESGGVERSNIHCESCGWGWSYIHDGHENRREGFAMNLLRDLGTVDFEQIEDGEEREAWHRLLDAAERVSEQYGIDYPLETFEDD